MSLPIWLKNIKALQSQILKKVELSDYKLSSIGPQIIGYLPKDASGWILELLFRDLASFAPEGAFTLYYSISEIKREIKKSKNLVVLCLHQGFLESLLKSGVSPDKIICLYTHSRIGLGISSRSQKIKAFLAMNTYEASQLLLAGLDDSKIHLFPIGFDHTLFFSDCKNDNCKDYDCVFSVAYFTDRGKHYELRKNYPLIIEIVSILAKKGKHIAIIGRNWTEAPIISSPNIDLLEIQHKQTPQIYRNSKVFVNVSRLEGGLTSWLEAFASGCIMLCTPTGFALEYKHGEDGSYIYPLSSNALEWANRIVQLIDYAPRLTEKSIHNRNAFLMASRFESLAVNLLRIANKN